MHIDFVLGYPPACHAEFLRDEHGRIRFLGRGKLDFVELERSLVVLAVDGAIVTAHVKAHGALVTGLEPHENAIELGKIAAHRLSVAKINLDTHVRIGVPLAKFIFNDDGTVGTAHGNGGRTPIHGIGASDHIRVIGEVDVQNVVQEMLIRKHGHGGNHQKHYNQEIHPEKGVNFPHNL